MSTDRWMDKEDVVHIYSGILFSYKRNKFESTEVRWMNLEPVIQNEVTQKEKNKCNIAYMWSLEKWYRWTYLQRRNRVSDIENNRVVSSGGRWVGWAGRLELTYIYCRQACSVTQLYLTLCTPMDRSPPGSSVHGIFLARILEWVAISSSRGSSQHRNQTHVSCNSCIGKQILYNWVT